MVVLSILSSFYKPVDAMVVGEGRLRKVSVLCPLETNLTPLQPVSVDSNIRSGNYTSNFYMGQRTSALSVWTESVRNLRRCCRIFCVVFSAGVCVSW